MSFVPGYEYDVFISYASDDDVYVDASNSRWVTQFALYFKRALQMHVGSQDLRIFHDLGSLASNHPLDSLIEAAQRSAMFLAVASRCYASRDWTKRELDAFMNSARDGRRLAAIELLPLETGESYPEPLQAHKRLRFYTTDPTTEMPQPLSPNSEGTAYAQKIHQLAEQVARQLRQLKTAAELSRAGEPLSAVPKTAANNDQPSDGTPRILLAQVTDDLEDERDQVQRYLEQIGFTVFPKTPYPQDGASFRNALNADLQQSTLFVQLLSSYRGRKPPDIPEGYQLYQQAQARTSGIKMLQWRRDDLNVAAVANEEQRALLSGNTVMACGLETFKAEIRRVATMLKPVKPKPNPPLVFIDAGKEDMEVAKLLQGEFIKGEIGAAIPIFGENDTAEDVRVDLEQNITDCSVLLFVYGRTTPTWVRKQILLYSKLKQKRSESLRLAALLNSPPPMKGDIGIVLPEIRVIDCSAGVLSEPIQALIAELAG